jgi:hypothetical protein
MMMIREYFGFCVKALGLFLAVSAFNVAYAYGWVGAGKIVAITTHYEGSITVDFNQIISNGIGPNATGPNVCVLKSSVIILAYEPNSQPRSAEKMGRILSLLLSAQARNATVGVYVERDDCPWGAALGVGGVQVFTN